MGAEIILLEMRCDFVYNQKQKELRLIGKIVKRGLACTFVHGEPSLVYKQDLLHKLYDEGLLYGAVTGKNVKERRKALR